MSSTWNVNVLVGNKEQMLARLQWYKAENCQSVIFSDHHTWVSRRRFHLRWHVPVSGITRIHCNNTFTLRTLTLNKYFYYYLISKKDFDRPFGDMPCGHPASYARRIVCSGPSHRRVNRRPYVNILHFLEVVIFCYDSLNWKWTNPLLLSLHQISLFFYVFSTFDFFDSLCPPIFTKYLDREMGDKLLPISNRLVLWSWNSELLFQTTTMERTYLIIYASYPSHKDYKDKPGKFYVTLINTTELIHAAIPLKETGFPITKHWGIGPTNCTANGSNTSTQKGLPAIGTLAYSTLIVWQPINKYK